MRAHTEETEPTPDERVLLTGFPAFTARRMAAKILASDPKAHIYLLARDKFGAQAREMIGALPADQQSRIETLIGDVCDMDLGLSGREVERLTGEVTTIQHLAGIYYHGVDRNTARRVNVDGTRGVLDFAREVKDLRRVVHWSTATVSGKRKGVVMEEELDENQGFHNFYEETKFEAEKLARDAQRRMPVTILRPGIIVGDSKTGDIDKFDGPYYLTVLFVNSPLGVRLPLPGRGAAPLHLVPIDYVIDAAYALSRELRAAGRTFHITDPNPFAARKVYELIAEFSEHQPPRGFIPSGITRALLHTPGIEKLARGPLSFLDSFDHLVFYNERNTRTLLADAGIRCPSFDSYVDQLVRFVREVQDARRTKLEDEVFDPFD
jgi:thioester reductase-like protein